MLPGYGAASAALAGRVNRRTCLKFNIPGRVNTRSWPSSPPIISNSPCFVRERECVCVCVCVCVGVGVGWRCTETQMVSSGNWPSAVVRDRQGSESYSLSPMRTVTLVTRARLPGAPGGSLDSSRNGTIEGPGIWGQLAQALFGLQRDCYGGLGPCGRREACGPPNIVEEWELKLTICWPTGYLERDCLTRGKDAFFQLVQPEGRPVLIHTKALYR